MHIPDAGAAVFERELQIEQWAARNVFSLVRGAVCFFRMLVFKSKGMVHLLCTKIASRVRKDGAKLKNELRQTWRRRSILSRFFEILQEFGAAWAQTAQRIKISNRPGISPWLA